MKVLVYGSRGWLGRQFLDMYPGSVASGVDIADLQAVTAELAAVKPDIALNAAGKTGRPNVDWCETHKEETVRANVTGPLVLLDACQAAGVRLVHLSSGCMYEGDNGGRGFTEDDEPNFAGSYYARTKAQAEAALREFPVLILRLRMPFDGTTEPRNLISKLRGYTKVLDEPNSLTYIPDFLSAADALMKKGATGIYNVVNPGVLSPYAMMMLYKEIVDPAHSFERLTVEALPGVVLAGRSNCALSGTKLEKEGIRLLPVEEAARDALEHLKTAV